MKDLVLTPAQARALAVIADKHPKTQQTVYPPIMGTVGVNVGGRLYTIDREGREES